MSNRLTETEIVKAIELYRTGKHQWEIGEILDRSQTSISNIMRANGIEMRPKGKTTYTDVNLELFKEVNSEASAYFLGLMYADGNVATNMQSFGIALQAEDADILEKFRDAISPSYELVYGTHVGKFDQYVYETEMVRIRVSRKEVCEQLVKLGCVPQKSLVLQFPTCVPDHLLHHFVRGYSDGDGSIHCSKMPSKNSDGMAYVWDIMSSLDFCTKAAEVLSDKLGIHFSMESRESRSKNKVGKYTGKIRVNGNNQVETALDWLYHDATIYLNRKYAKYLEFKEYRASKPRIDSKPLNLSKAMEDEMVTKYNEGISSIKLSTMYNMSKPSVLAILHKRGVKIRSRNQYPYGGVSSSV